jgi:hypothetical protein
MATKAELKKYRATLIDTLRFLNESYDKLLITLSGGALGISIAFLKDVVTLDNVVRRDLLLYAWLAFILSLAAVLGRLMFGIEAYRRAIKQVDSGTIYKERVGGKYSLLTRMLHIGSAAFLLLGLLMLATFAFQNVGE